jgi:hypothetical protein
MFMLKNKLFVWMGLFLGVIFLVLTFTYILNLTKPSPFANLKGKYLVAISDGDFFASTCGNGRIPSTGDSRYQDALTSIPLPFNQKTMVSLNVSNSVNGPPEALAVSPDGKTAFVVDYVGERGAGATTNKDLPPGRSLTMVDFTNPIKPQVLDRKNVGLFSESVDVHASGRWVVIATDSSQSEVLQLVPIVNSRLGKPINISLDSLDIPTAPGLLNASYAEWHPSGRYLALNLYHQNRIVFLEFVEDRASGKVSLVPWGNPVTVGNDPHSRRFTPDGRYFITADFFREQFKAQMILIQMTIGETSHDFKVKISTKI